MNWLERSLGNGSFVVTTELNPAVWYRPDDVIRLVQMVHPWVDAVIVPNLADVAIDQLLARVSASSVELVFGIDCRHHDQLTVRAELLAAWTRGVSSILLTTDDGAARQMSNGWDDPRQSLASWLMGRTRQEFSTAESSWGNEHSWCVGLLESPITPSAGTRSRPLTGKLRAGAQFVLTQRVDGIGELERLMGDVDMRVGASRCALIATVDPEVSGLDESVEMLGQIERTPGIAGVNLVVSPDGFAMMPLLLQRAGQSRSDLASA
ncbi:MAG TPA: hypothetical protein VN793_04470 [Acidimicrobiales bacterium]|nr:hypothetical protein [Acidimicrobiales bacterium]